MLSTGAFNALLKTLEEPPEHVKFILATTEPQKLPATILSRCQRFDFKKISEEDISKRLQIVCNEINIEITKEALKVISTLAEGALRDALSILERCIQDGETKIDEAKIKDLVGIPKFTYINNITKAIINYLPEEALKAIDDVIKEGKDLSNLLWEIIKYVKDILVYKTSKNTSIYNEEEIKEIEELANKAEKERLLSIIYELSNIENEMKWSTQKTILFQVGILKLCNGEVNSNTSFVDNREIIALKNKITTLENKINQMSTVSFHKQTQNVENKPAYSINPAPKTQNTAVTKPNTDTLNVKLGNGINAWPKIVADLKQEGKIMLYTNLINSNATELNDMTVGISFSKGLTPFGKTILEKNENVTELEKRISMEFGKPMRIKYIEDNKQESNSKVEENQIESFAQDLDLPFNVIE